ncbi:MAG: hypothetical protein ACR2J5_13840 [Geodermatophilaceae bacterium]
MTWTSFQVGHPVHLVSVHAANARAMQHRHRGVAEDEGRVVLGHDQFVQGAPLSGLLLERQILDTVDLGIDGRLGEARVVVPSMGVEQWREPRTT